VVIAPGLSVHFIGRAVGIYSDRLEAGRGFAEMPTQDFVALLRYFASDAGLALVENHARRTDEC
jgi:hypothetical protein